MIDPAKVLGFLNIFRDWDPSLAFVMIGALIISSPFFHYLRITKNQFLWLKINIDYTIRLKR